MSGYNRYIAAQLVVFFCVLAGVGAVVIFMDWA
jgi:hypothetical protein